MGAGVPLQKVTLTGGPTTYPIISNRSFNLFGAVRLKFGSVLGRDISLPLLLKVIEFLNIVLISFDSLIDILYLCVICKSCHYRAPY